MAIVPRMSRVALYALGAVYVCLVAIVIAGILYTNYVNQRNNHRWCSVLVSIDDAFQQVSNNPTSTPAGRHIAEEFHRLRIDFEC